MSVLRIKKNDMVVSVAGNSVGKTGKVLQVVKAGKRAIVEGLRPVKKTVRKSQETPKGDIVEKDAPIDISNLMPYCPSCKKGVKIKRDKDGNRRVRRCRACGHSFDG
jgi:large subunit ribosomal protein L24